MNTNKAFTIGKLQIHVGDVSPYADARTEIRIGPFDTRFEADTFSRKHLKEHLEALVKAGLLEPTPPRVRPHIPATEEYEVLDFRGAQHGMLVKRSDLFKESASDPDNNQIGIIESLSFYQDAKGRIVAWPVVHWEGNVCSTLTCPRLLVPYRDNSGLRTIVVDNGQWGTNGPPTDS